MSRAWTPILSGALAEQARAYARDIADALMGTGGSSAFQYPRSLSTGDCGVAVTHAYFATAFPDRGYDEAAAQRLGQCMEAIAAEEMVASLHVGWAGVTWAVEHLQGRLFEPDEEDANESIDEELLVYLRDWSGQTAYDLVFGPVGLAVYALERLPRPSAAAALELVVERLAALAEQGPEGVRWHTPPELLKADTRAKYPSGYYDLGIAHGIPGIIAVLGAIYDAGIARERIRPLLEGAITWLLAQRLDEKAGSVLPSWIGPEVPKWSSRSAWCYGDPSTAVAVLRAAQALGHPAFEAEALEMGRHAARREVDKTGVVDPCLCHGSAGLAHIFNRLFHASGDALFAQAAQQWIERTLAMRKSPEEGVAGCISWNNMVREWQPTRDLLTGAAGVALALLAATSEDEPGWDRTFLLSYRSRPG